MGINSANSKIKTMETATLKEEFHKLIESYEDESRLFQYFHLMKDEKELEVDTTDDLTPEQEQRLLESINQIENGRYKTQDQFNLIKKKWRTKLSTPKIS
ncbi:MAG: hypothetical protein ACKVOU_13750 [Cytophagales bacterium]